MLSSGSAFEMDGNGGTVFFMNKCKPIFMSILNQKYYFDLHVSLLKSLHTRCILLHNGQATQNISD
jgi:hypothetical protein